MARDSKGIYGIAALGGAVLLGSTFLSTPVTAQTVGGLKAQISELSQRLDELQNQKVATPVIAPAQAVTNGVFPGSIKLPGTNTSFRVSGYVKADILYSTVQGLGDSFAATSIPLEGSAQDASDGQTRLHARQTRFWIETRTPSDFGEVKTMIQGDFFGGGGNELVSNSSHLRLRHAFGTIGKFLAGQTWSNFMHLGAYPDTVDFFGPQGMIFVRQGQIRYTVPFEGGWKLELSAENPQSVTRGPGSAAASNGGVGSNDDQIPDFTAKVTFSGPWGFVSLVGLVGALDVNTAVTGGVPAVDDTEVIWGIHGGARINTWGKDSIAATAAYLDGATRYMLGVGLNAGDIGGYIDLSVPGAPDVETIDQLGLHLSYEHWWTDNLRSTLAGGYSSIDFPSAIHPGVSFAGLKESTATAQLNLMWLPASGVTLGIEYTFGYAEFNVAGIDDDNTAHRVQAMAKWSF